MSHHQARLPANQSEMSRNQNMPTYLPPFNNEGYLIAFNCLTFGDDTRTIHLNAVSALIPPGIPSSGCSQQTVQFSECRLTV